MSSSTFRLFLIFASILWLSIPASASDLKEPYRIQIVVDVAKHRLLTDVFKEQLKRELQDGIQAALGKLAKVEVTDKHPKLVDIRAQGLQKALDAWGNHPATDKVHFVLIDYSGVRYEIQTRQYDAQLQTASPTVRHERMRDRAYVARAAALMLEHDIGLVGTIVTEPDKARQVKVEFRGGGLGVDLKRWLKKGAVLGLPAGPGEALPSTLLVLEGELKDGLATCTLFSRYRLPRASGMKAALLGTRSGTLRIRLVEEVPGKRGVLRGLQSSVRLEFRRRSYEGEDATMAPPVTVRPGSDIFTEKFKEDRGRFDRVVFISVLSGETLKARIPVPLIDDRLVTLKIPPSDESEDDVLERFHSLERNVRIALQVIVDLIAEINALTAKPAKRAEAMAQVKQTLQRGQDDYRRLSKEREEVAKEIEKLPARDRPSMAGIDARLKQIADSENRLLGHIALLEKIDKEENDPEKKKWEQKKADATFLEKELELGKAIGLYEEIPEKFRTKELERHLAELKKDWKPRNQEHAKARAFIYEEYPKLTTEELAAKMEKDKDEVAKHFEQCKNVSDRVGPSKLLRATNQHIDRIKAEAEKLKPTVNIDDEKPARLIADLSPKVLKLHRDLEAYLGKKKGE